MLYLLARAFLNLHVSRYQAADTDLRHCRQLIDELSDQESVKTLQLRVHMLVLGVSVSLAKGTLMDLSTGKDLFFCRVHYVGSDVFLEDAPLQMHTCTHRGALLLHKLHITPSHNPWMYF